jgi:hypothetical protein
MAKVPLKGSERAAVPGALELAPAEATERMEVSVIIRRRGPGEMQSRVVALAAGERARRHEPGRVRPGAWSRS